MFIFIFSNPLAVMFKTTNLAPSLTTIWCALPFIEGIQFFGVMTFGTGFDDYAVV